MSALKRASRSIVMMICMMMLSVTAHAVSGIVNINFDNTFDKTLTPPFVGSGYFWFYKDPGNGIWKLDDFEGYEFRFTFPGISTTFTEYDIAVLPENVRIILFGEGPKRDVIFSNAEPFSNAFYGGSIVFYSNQQVLTFEPPGYKGDMNLYYAGPYFGSYRNATPLPEPSTFMLLGAGLGGLAILRRKAPKE